jgi:hypothetical protein
MEKLKPPYERETGNLNFRDIKKVACWSRLSGCTGKGCSSLALTLNNTPTARIYWLNKKKKKVESSCPELLISDVDFFSIKNNFYYV